MSTENGGKATFLESAELGKSPYLVNVRIGIVCSNYYIDISESLLASAKHTLQNHYNVEHDAVHVSGAWEIPAVAKVMAQSNHYQGIVALGCVIRGETNHFDFLCERCAAALMNIGLEHLIPVGFGVLTVENYAQALHRSGSRGHSTSKGAEAVVGVMSAINAIHKIRNNRFDQP